MSKPLEFNTEEMNLIQGGLTLLVKGLSESRQAFSSNGTHWSSSWCKQRIEVAEALLQKLQGVEG